MNTAADANLVLVILQGVNTLALLGFAFGAGKYAQTVTTLAVEVAALRAVRQEWSDTLATLQLRVSTIEGQLGGRRTTDKP